MGESIGALWTKTKKDDPDFEYYSGFVKSAGVKINIVVFANQKKDPANPEHKDWPDYNILRNTPRERK